MERGAPGLTLVKAACRRGWVLGLRVKGYRFRAEGKGLSVQGLGLSA